MCRSDTSQFGPHRPDPSRILTTNAFYLKLKLKLKQSAASACNNNNNYLTLLYLPRSNGAPIEINGCKTRPESPAYVTLHRVVNAGDSGSVVFGSVERVRVGEGARFEVYIGEERLLKGVFRKNKAWRVECTCVMESDEVSGVEVCVAVEGGSPVSYKVAMRRRRRSTSRILEGLEEIPEEEEECWDSCCCEGGSSEREVEEEVSTAGEEAEIELEMEGLRWAVDVGIWAVCLGIGVFVSATTLRTRKMLL